jgi:ATP-dependent Zn protease
VDLLDPALLRPGRFDRVVSVELPDKDGRLQILRIHAKGKPLAEEVDLEKVAQSTFGFSGAHLESIMNEAAIHALRQKRSHITNDDLREAVEKVMLGEKLDRTPTEQERMRIAYHESGHAMMCEKVNAGSVASVTIVSRGSALGYMRQHAEDDRYLYTKDELMGRIQVCMAGAVAEELIFGQRSTGAGGDIEQAVNIAKQIIYSGLSSLGVVTRELPAGILSRTITKIIQEQEHAVREYLTANQEQLHALAEELLQEEKLSGLKLREILKKSA